MSSNENTSNSPFITADVLSQISKNLDYPIRGRCHLRAVELKRELKNGLKKDFNSVVHLNIGDCQAFGQQPITYIRQVMTLCLMPELMNRDEFPDDVKQRARRILDSCFGGAIGAYTDVTGIDVAKQDIAEYITTRDGISTYPKNICLTAGATDGIKSLIEFLQTEINDKPAGVLIPVPTYSAYTAFISQQHTYPVRYYLDEENDWALSIEEMQRAYNESLDKCKPRMLIIINPGNPTGNVLTKENIQDIIKFAYDNKLIIIADEVYQLNIYADDAQFHSFKKVAYEMEFPYNKLEIASLHSASKGYSGECGSRAGYIEFFNFSDDVVQYFYKFMCCKSCTAVLGQACLSAIMTPPKKDEPSYPLFIKEKTKILSGLKEKAQFFTTLLNSFKGIKCRQVKGALYAFPNLYIPPRAVEHAKTLNMEADEFYCIELLNKTGICFVPGSGLGQKPGTYHFRATITIEFDEAKKVFQRFEKFHNDFLETWK